MIENPSPSKKKGFSLIELMVVLGLVGLLMAFAAPNLFNLILANSLTGEGSVLQNQLTLAQQLAVSKSSDVEIRFFRYADSSLAQDELLYRGYQLFQYNRDGDLEPVSSFFRIRAPVVISDTLSSLLQQSSTSSSDARYGFISPHQGSSLAPTGSGGEPVTTAYTAFRFRPDGSTDLPNRSGGSGDTWYITLVQGEGSAQDSSPDNFVCLQVNSYNGKVTVFRP